MHPSHHQLPRLGIGRILPARGLIGPGVAYPDASRLARAGLQASCTPRSGRSATSSSRICPRSGFQPVAPVRSSERRWQGTHYSRCKPHRRTRRSRFNPGPPGRWRSQPRSSIHWNTRASAGKPWYSARRFPSELPSCGLPAAPRCSYTGLASGYPFQSMHQD